MGNLGTFIAFYISRMRTNPQIHLFLAILGMAACGRTPIQMDESIRSALPLAPVTGPSEVQPTNTENDPEEISSEGFPPEEILDNPADTIGGETPTASTLVFNAGTVHFTAVPSMSGVDQATVLTGNEGAIKPEYRTGSVCAEIGDVTHTICQFVSLEGSFVLSFTAQRGESVTLYLNDYVYPHENNLLDLVVPNSPYVPASQEGSAS